MNASEKKISCEDGSAFEVLARFICKTERRFDPPVGCAHDATGESDALLCAARGNKGGMTEREGEVGEEKRWRNGEEIKE